MTKRDIFCITLTALLFSTMEITLKVAGSGLDSFQLTFLRFAIGGIVLLPFALRDVKKRKLKLSLSDWIYMLILGIICIPVSMLLFQIAIMNANANLVSVIICSNPFFVMIFSHFILEDKFTGSKLIVLLLGITGLVFAANPFNMAEGNSVYGIVCVLMAAMTFGLYSTLGKLRIERIGNFTMTCFSFILGSVVMLIPMLILHKPVVAGICADNILLVLYIGIAVTGIGYLSFFLAVSSCGPTNASFVFFIKPIFAPFFALMLLGEDITWNIVVGIALLLCGSTVNIISSKKKARALKSTEPPGE